MKLLYLNLFVDDCLGDLQELKQSCADLVGRDWKDGDKARAAEVLDAFISLFDVLYAFTFAINIFLFSLEEEIFSE